MGDTALPGDCPPWQGASDYGPLYFSQLAAPPRPGQAVPGPPSAPVTPRARPRRRDGDGHKITSGGVVAGYKLRPVGPRGFPAFQAVLAAMLSWLR